jgi:hypothetical protein
MQIKYTNLDVGGFFLYQNKKYQKIYKVVEKFDALCLVKNIKTKTLTTVSPHLFDKNPERYKAVNNLVYLLYGD